MVRTCEFFFFNDTATTEIYTLSLHDALPILSGTTEAARQAAQTLERDGKGGERVSVIDSTSRSEEHTSELQSRQYLVCRLLLEKKKHTSSTPISAIVIEYITAPFYLL